MRRRSLAVVVVLLFVAAACRNSATAPSDTNLPFTASPLALANIEYITPLGNLNPPDHTLPTDHIYFYHHLYPEHRNLPQFEVVAPAGGRVTQVRRESDDVILVQVTSKVSYKLAHILLDAGIAKGQSIQAGQRLGTTSPDAGGIDLHVINDDVTLAFITPARYQTESLHCDKPLTFFSDELRPQLYARVTGVVGDKDGRIDFDQRGTLAGNWYHETVPVNDSASRTWGPKHLSFAREPTDASKIRISIGGTIAETGVYAIGTNNPDPANVSVQSGVVTFNITGGKSGTTSGPMQVEMQSDTKIRITFAGTSNIYVR